MVWLIIGTRLRFLTKIIMIIYNKIKTSVICNIINIISVWYYLNLLLVSFYRLVDRRQQSIISCYHQRDRLQGCNYYLGTWYYLIMTRALSGGLWCSIGFQSNVWNLRRSEHHSKLSSWSDVWRKRLILARFFFYIIIAMYVYNLVKYLHKQLCYDIYVPGIISIYFLFYSEFFKTNDYNNQVPYI